MAEKKLLKKTRESGRIDRLLSVVLILVIVLAIGTTVYVIAAPKEYEQFSEFYILGENRTAYDYPDQMVAGRTHPMYIGVGNHEYRDVTYTVEIWVTREEFDTLTNTTTILAMNPLSQASFALPHNQTEIIPYNLSVQETLYNRIEFLLFNETVPGMDVQGRDRINASYRDLNLGITVR